MCIDPKGMIGMLVTGRHVYEAMHIGMTWEG